MKLNRFDEDQLYLRVHLNLLRGREDFSPNRVPMNIFRVHQGAMSVNWSKYSTPKQTLHEAKQPEKNGVVVMNVGEVRKIRPLEVKHAPIPKYRAHANVVGIPEKGPKKIKIRSYIAEISRWVIPVDFNI